MARGMEVCLGEVLSEQNIYYSGNCVELDSIFFVSPWQFQARVLQEDDSSFVNIY